MSRHTSSATSVGGAALSAYGLAFKPPQPGWQSSAGALRDGILGRNPSGISVGAYNLKQSIPIYGTDPNMQPNRALVATGVGVWAGGKLVRRVAPWVRRTLQIKVSRHHKLALV